MKKSIKKEYGILILITCIGAVLRFIGLTENPLWIDESLFGFYVRDGATQEFLPVWIAQGFGLTAESLRYISAVAGTLTIPAIYFAMKNKFSLHASVFVAIFPLFVFWSRMARPYALAGLFIVMGWRYWLFYIPAMLTTPISLLGMKFTKDRWKAAAGFVTIAVIAFLIREDSDRDFWNLKFILSSSRLLYVPLLGIVMHGMSFSE